MHACVSNVYTINWGPAAWNPSNGVKQLCFKLLVASSRAVKPSLAVGMAAD